MSNWNKNYHLLFLEAVALPHDGSSNINSFGTRTYYRNSNDLLHRTDGPAIVSDDYVEWHLNGILHRDDEPAIIHNDGYIIYYKNNKCHRDDGPATITEKNEYLWYIDNINVTAEINLWLQTHNINYPFSEEELRFFQLTWL